MARDHLKWNGTNINYFEGWYGDLFFSKHGRPKVTKKIVGYISEMLESAAHKVGIKESKERLAKRFLEYGTIDRLYEAREEFETKCGHR
jgi:hypothetical protein